MSDTQAPATPPPAEGVDEVLISDADEKALLNRIGKAWWLVLLLGVISVLVGILVLIRPFTAVNVAAIIFGIWLLVSGVFQLAQAFNSKLETVTRVLNAITGVIGIVLGIICLESVQNRISLLILFIGIWWIMHGIVQIVGGASGQAGGGWAVFSGVLGLIAGIVVLIWPINSLAVLTLVAGVWLIVLGIFEIIASFRVKSLATKDQPAQ